MGELKQFTGKLADRPEGGISYKLENRASAGAQPRFIAEADSQTKRERALPVAPRGGTFIVRSDAVADRVAARKGLSRDVLDASVLGCPPVADLLLSLAAAVEVPFTPLWSKKILKEAYQIHTGPWLSWEPREAIRFRARLMSRFLSSRVVRYEYWLPQCTNPERARHVLACAIAGKADTIVTYNLDAFGREHLAPWKIRAMHPDDFLLRLYALFPERVSRELQEVRAEDALRTLAPHAPLFAAAIADSAHSY